MSHAFEWRAMCLLRNLAPCFGRKAGHAITTSVLPGLQTPVFANATAREPKLPFSDWEASRTQTGHIAYAAIPLLRQAHYAGALVVSASGPVGFAPTAGRALSDLGHSFSRALFDDRQQAALVDTACAALRIAGQASTSLTSLTQSICQHACGLVEQAHSIDLAACAALVPHAPATRAARDLALLMQPDAHAPAHHSGYSRHSGHALNQEIFPHEVVGGPSRGLLNFMTKTSSTSERGMTKGMAAPDGLQPAVSTVGVHQTATQSLDAVVLHGAMDQRPMGQTPSPHSGSACVGYVEPQDCPSPRTAMGVRVVALKLQDTLLGRCVAATLANCKVSACRICLYWGTILISSMRVSKNVKALSTAFVW